MTACAAGLALALCLQLALGGCFRCAEPKSGSMSEAATSATLIERYQRSCLFVDTPDYGRRFDYQLESDSLRWFLVFFYASYFGSKEALLDNDANSSALVQFLARTWDLYKNATISEIWSLLAESDRDRYDLDLMRHVLNFAHQAAFFIRQELRRTNCVWSRFSLRFDRVIRLAFDLKRELQKAFAIGDTSAFLLLANIVFSNPIAISPNISAKNFIEKAGIVTLFDISCCSYFL